MEVKCVSGEGGVFYGIFGKRGSNGIYKKNVGLLAFIPQIGSVWVGGKGGLCGGIIREGGGRRLMTRAAEPCRFV